MLRRAALIWCAVVAQAPGAEPAPAAPRPPMRDFIGLNVHTVQFRPEVYRPVARQVRDYHNFSWDVGDQTDHYPAYPLARNGVDWGAMYAKWGEAGYRIDVSLMFDDTEPRRWVDPARDAWAFGFEFARFFGPSGRRQLVEAVEIGNEPGKYDDAAYRTLFENAARGIRRADPKLKVATCATFDEPSGPYHKSLDVFRGLEDLVDVVNVHSYPELEGYPTWRRSFPEDPRLDFLGKIRRVIAWRDARAPGRPVWLTEFGYDSTTRPPAAAGDFKDWVGVTDEQQAQYIVRSFLILAALDLDRAYLFWFDDDDKPSVHGSSGLTRRGRPKPSFHAVAHLQATLGDYRFGRVVADRPGEVMAVEFVHRADPGRPIWAAWSPTGPGRAQVVRLARVPGRLVAAERMPLAAGETVARPLPGVGAGGDLEVEVSGSPIYLRFER